MSRPDALAPFLMVVDLNNLAPAPFAVVAVYPERRAETGGCEGVVVSLHMMRAEAEKVARGSYSEARQ